jgi:hypothetical protein
MDAPRKPPARAATKPATKPAAKPVPKAAPKAPAVPAARRPARAKPVQAAAPGSISPTEREELVRLAAYFRAEQRGFAPGREWEDWLIAEAEVSVNVDAAPAPRKTAPRKAGKAPKA